MPDELICCNLEWVSSSSWERGFTRCIYSDSPYNVGCEGNINYCPALDKYKKEYEEEVEKWQERLDKVNKAIATKKLMPREKVRKLREKEEKEYWKGWKERTKVKKK